MDGIDSLFDDLDEEAQDTVAVYMIEELISRRPNQRDRLEDLPGRAVAGALRGVR